MGNTYSILDAICEMRHLEDAQRDYLNSLCYSRGRKHGDHEWVRERYHTGTFLSRLRTIGANPREERDEAQAGARDGPLDGPKSIARTVCSKLRHWMVREASLCLQCLQENHWSGQGPCRHTRVTGWERWWSSHIMSGMYLLYDYTM